MFPALWRCSFNSIVLIMSKITGASTIVCAIYINVLLRRATQIPDFHTQNQHKEWRKQFMLFFDTLEIYSLNKYSMN